MYSKIVGDCANLTSTLRQYGIFGDLTIDLISKSDGEAFQSGLAGINGIKNEVYDRESGQFERWAVIGGIRFVWRVPDPEASTNQADAPVDEQDGKTDA